MKLYQSLLVYQEWARKASMEVGAILNQRPIEPIGERSSKPIVPIVKTEKIKLTKQEVLGCDIGLSEYKDVMHPDFYKWYCKAWYVIGRERFHQLAAQARADGKDPARLFSSLIKKELSNA